MMKVQAAQRGLLVPAADDYLTDGVRLYQVRMVRRTGAIVLEDVRSEQIRSVHPSEMELGWRRVTPEGSP
jgi:hypothetical protein